MRRGPGRDPEREMGTQGETPTTEDQSHKGRQEAAERRKHRKEKVKETTSSTGGKDVHGPGRT